MIKIFVTSDSRYNVDRNFVKAVIEDALAHNRIKGKVEVGVSVVGNRRMHELNYKYRHINEPTDVLSFPLEDPTFTPTGQYKGFVNPPDKILRLGDVVISYPEVATTAAERGASVEEELKVLLEHGLDHLLGIHHQ